MFGPSMERYLYFQRLDSWNPPVSLVGPASNVAPSSEKPWLDRTYLYILVWVSSRISGRLTPLRRVDFLSFEKLEFAEMMLSKFPQFSTEQLWRPLSRKILVFWVVYVPKIQKHNSSISGSTCIDFLVVLDFLERHWQVITTNNMIFGCIWVRLKTGIPNLWQLEWG